MISRNWEIVVQKGQVWTELDTAWSSWKRQGRLHFIHFNRKAKAGNQEPHSLAQLCGTKWQGSHSANS